jgi:tetratricopeptide (TPR) repeat protein
MIPWTNMPINPDDFMPMRKKQRKSSPSRKAGGSDHFSAPSDFYSATPAERPLNDDRRSADARDVRKTNRHQKVMGKRKEQADIREKAALVAILRSIVMILLLVIALFVLWKGTGLYEESRIAADLEESATQEQTPAMQAVELIEDFDIQNQEERRIFAQRIESWKEADRLVRSADALLLRNIYDQAIAQCQDALKADPSHRGALERLGKLYSAKKDYASAVNVYIRLMSVDPSHKGIQKKLIQALDAYGDNKAVAYMAAWYFDQNTYDADVQRYLANALYGEEKFEEAVVAYDRVLRDAPDDIEAMENQAAAYMQLKEYEKALDLLETLRRKNYRNPAYYKQIVVCNAQLERGKETVDALGRAAQLFGEQMVLGLIQDPRLDPVREDPAFQGFADRVGGEEFRLWLEKMAKGIKVGKQDLPEAQTLRLEVPDIKRGDSELLKLKK